MSFIEALTLGTVQGLTEFLPISSTAHLRVVPELFGWRDPGAAFTAVVQLGTLVAVLLYFRSDIGRLCRGFFGDIRAFRFSTNPDARTAWMIVAGTVPIVVCGLLLKKQIEGPLRRLDVIAWTTVIFALLLWVAEWRANRQGSPREEESIGWRDALWIGVFQALALIPGASRSGVTITAGLFAGLSRSASARFSFLLSLPAVFAAAVKELYDERKALLASSNDVFQLLVACVAAGLVGYASIAFLLNYLRRHSTYVFIGYRLFFGVLLVVLMALGRLSPETVSTVVP